MVIHVSFLNHIFAWLLGISVIPGEVLTFNPWVATQPFTGVGVDVGVIIGVDVGVFVGVDVGVFVGVDVGVFVRVIVGDGGV
jgi:hypothetical protein